MTQIKAEADPYFFINIEWIEEEFYHRPTLSRFSEMNIYEQMTGNISRFSDLMEELIMQLITDIGSTMW